MERKALSSSEAMLSARETEAPRKNSLLAALPLRDLNSSDPEVCEPGDRGGGGDRSSALLLVVMAVAVAVAVAMVVAAVVGE